MLPLPPPLSAPPPRVVARQPVPAGLHRPVPVGGDAGPNDDPSDLARPRKRKAIYVEGPGSEEDHEGPGAATREVSRLRRGIKWGLTVVLGIGSVFAGVKSYQHYKATVSQPEPSNDTPPEPSAAPKTVVCSVAPEPSVSASTEATNGEFTTQCIFNVDDRVRFKCNGLNTPIATEGNVSRTDDGKFTFTLTGKRSDNGNDIKCPNIIIDTDAKDLKQTVKCVKK